MCRIASDGYWKTHRMAGSLLLVVLVGGCASNKPQSTLSTSRNATPSPQAELPTGHWTGSGTFVYKPWKTDEPAGQEVFHRSYPTALSIHRGELNGHQVMLLEIESERGSLPKIAGDKTSLKVALVETRVSPIIVLYRLVGIAVNSKPDEALAYDEKAPPFAASCITDAGVTVLQINYGNGFTDVFRFHGHELDKSGSVYDEKEGLIHWTEHLVRQD